MERVYSHQHAGGAASPPPEQNPLQTFLESTAINTKNALEETKNALEDTIGNTAQALE